MEPDAIGHAWKSTCRVLFGREAGSLDANSGWLLEYARAYEGAQLQQRESRDGEPVFVSRGYPKSARFISCDAKSFMSKFEPVPADDLKDVDSLLGAIKERVAYSGNIVLGNSSNITESTNISDSHFIHSSSTISGSKYVSYCRGLKESEYCFGCFGGEKNSYSVKCLGSELVRCFECHMSELLSDSYFCMKAQNCHECMFCFGTQNTSYAIANAPLPKEKYLSLKAKLLAELSGLVAEGKAFSMFSLLSQIAKSGKPRRAAPKKGKGAEFDIAPLEAAFQATTKLTLGKSLHGLESYSDFLLRGVPKNITLPSAISGGEVVAGGYRANLVKIYSIPSRIASDEEMHQLGQAQPASDVSKIRMDADSLAQLLEPIAYCNIDKRAGTVANVLGSAVLVNARDCLMSSSILGAKRCAYSFWAASSDSIFGSSDMFESSFCLKCYDSKGMARVFEADSCKSCSDATYLHNCENVRNSMFCFNAKNLSNAIGNAEMPREECTKARQNLLSQLADELERKKLVKWGILSLVA